MEAIAEYLNEMLVWVMGMYLALLTWTAKRQIARLDALENNQRENVSKAENETLRREIREDFRATHLRLDALISMAVDNHRGGSSKGN